MRAPAELLSGGTLERLERLTIRWSQSFQGRIGGDIVSRFSGVGHEFLDHRHYQQGDDLRAVNWRAFMRLERMFLKLFRSEPRIPVRILIDTSESMAAGTAVVASDVAGVREQIDDGISGLIVRPGDAEVLASALSGGNQQKLIVGREMAGEPRVLIAAHPTRGVDVGAQAAIWTRLSAVRRAGVAVLLVSADLEELIGISDRILVILRGRLVGEFDPSAIGPEDLGAAMTGADAA